MIIRQELPVSVYGNSIAGRTAVVLRKTVVDERNIRPRRSACGTYRLIRLGADGKLYLFPVKSDIYGRLRRFRPGGTVEFVADLNRAAFSRRRFRQTVIAESIDTLGVGVSLKNDALPVFD